MAQVQCQVEIPKANSESRLTVGDLFFVLCEGEWPPFKKESLELRLEEADKYKLKLIEIDFESESQAKLTVASYKPGAHQLKALQLVDAENSVVLSDLQFQVESVINPQEPVTEPLGPMGPFRLPLPIWYLVAFAVLLLIVILFVGNRWRLRREKKKLLAAMRLDESAQEANFQFYQSLRKLKRALTGAELPREEMEAHLKILNEAFKLYLARRFDVPTLHWSERRILSDLKKNHRSFYGSFRLDVRKSLAELSRAQKAGDLKAKDLEQLMNLLSKQVDRIEAWRKGRGQ